MNPEPNDSFKMTESIMSAVRSQQRKGRALIATALSLGILSIIASIAIAWANIVLVTPMERLLLEDYPLSTQQLTPQPGKNAEGKPVLSKAQLELRHLQVTAAQGTAILVTDASIALLAVGTLVILLLVNFNRRVTLRQINLSLAQISNQINELQRRQGPSS